MPRAVEIVFPKADESILVHNPEARHRLANIERNMIERRTFLKGASMLALAASTSRMYVEEMFAQQVPNSAGTGEAQSAAGRVRLPPPHLRRDEN